MEIRRATVEDADLLARLNAPVQQLHHEAQSDIFKPYLYSPELVALYRARLSEADTFIFIGEAAGEPVGYIVAQMIERADNPYAYAARVLMVDEMSVNPEHRGRGCGEALMQHVFDRARSAGISRVNLQVWAFNERAIAFYQRQGFAPRDIRMEIHLEQT